MSTEAEEKPLTLLSTLRKGFEQLKIGAPTVCAAGGRLVAALVDELMEPELFKKTVLDALIR